MCALMSWSECEMPGAVLTDVGGAVRKDSEDTRGIHI